MQFKLNRKNIAALTIYNCGFLGFDRRKFFHQFWKVNGAQYFLNISIVMNGNMLRYY